VSCAYGTQTPKTPGAAIAEHPQCDIRAYVRLGGGDIAVYADPSESATKLGALPAYKPQGTSGGPIAHIIAAHADQWLYYDGIDDFGEPVDAAAAPGPIRGWVRNDKFAVDLAMSEVSPALQTPWKVRLRAQPSKDAALVRTYMQEAHDARVLSCRSDWIRVTVSLKSSNALPKTGWLGPRAHCGHPFTTCGHSGAPD